MGWVAAIPLLLLLCVVDSKGPAGRLWMCHGCALCCRASQAEWGGRGAHGALGTLRHAAGIKELRVKVVGREVSRERQSPMDDGLCIPHCQCPRLTNPHASEQPHYTWRTSTSSSSLLPASKS